MTDGEDRLRTITGNTPETRAIMSMVEMWRAQLAALYSNNGSIDEATLSRAMTAASIMAGTLFGHAVIAGVAGDQDKRRAAEAAARNFRSGVEIGKRMAARVAAAMPVGGHA